MKPIVFSLAAILAAGAAVAEPRTYVNARFGTSVAFPAEIFVDEMEPPMNGDGFTFLSRDGASLAVLGMNNALEDTPHLLAERAKARNEPGYELTYSRAGDDWVVLSGYDAGLVFYERFEFGADDVIHGVLIRYPPELEAVYDPLVGEIAGSLTGP